ncbi:MAG: hypothetical protein AAGA85_05900, partial [Bacteroidota bacterium]
WWQYQNGFPSFQFHLTGRATAFDWEDPMSFLLQQSLSVGPALFMAFAYRARDFWERSLKVLIIGCYFFFFLASFRGVVHIQWTSLAFFPAILLATRWLAAAKSRLIGYPIGLFFLVTVLLRLQLMFPILPGEKIGPHYIHGQEEWAMALAEEVGDAALVFEYDLKEPSIYSFYSGKDALALYPAYRKRSQYDLWAIEDTIQHRSAVVARKYDFEGAHAFQRNKRKIYWQRTSELNSFQNVRIQMEDINASEAATGLTLTVHNHRKVPMTFPSGFELFLREVRGRREDLRLGALPSIIPSGAFERLTIQIEEPLAGTYRVGIRGGLLSPSLNSDPFIISLPEREDE